MTLNDLEPPTLSAKMTGPRLSRVAWALLKLLVCLPTMRCWNDSETVAYLK